MGLHALLHEPKPELGPGELPRLQKLNLAGRIVFTVVAIALACAIGIPLGLGMAGTSGGPSDRPQTERQVCESRWTENAERFDPAEHDAYIDTCMTTNGDIDAINGR